METRNSKLGEIFSSFLGTITNFHDEETLALVKAVAVKSPSPKTVEIGLQLLDAWNGTGLNIPTPIPPSPAFTFPKDHGEHWDIPIEWRFVTLSLTLENGTVVSIIANFFRKAIATSACAPDIQNVDRQIYSTSIGVTIQPHDSPGIQYALPTTTFAPIEGGVEIGNDPFHMTIGKNSLVGTADVFPLHVHIEDAGDPITGRPAVTVSVECGAANPLFLQGENGYVGPTVSPGETPPFGWYYYSWPQQPTTGKVVIGNDTYKVRSGLAWVDHQWGGAQAPVTPRLPRWSGWCWFEFQFDGSRSLTLSCAHDAIVDGKLPLINPGFGTYIERDNTTLVPAALEVGDYVKSSDTDALYPSDWTIEVGSRDGPIFLVVKPMSAIPGRPLWMGALTEYSESSCTVTAIGFANGKAVEMSGVGYCEGVSFEDPAEHSTRCKTWLQAILAKG